jgi:hypothetical protein
LQASGEVRCVADHRLLLRATLADEVAHHGDPGRDADPDLQGDISTRPQIRHGLNEREPGVDSLLCIVLMRLRITEIGKHAVAHISGHDSLIVADDLGDAAMKERHHLAHVFRIKPRRERGRADQIAEHHRKLASLSTVPPRFGRRVRLAGGRPLQFGECTQHLAAMPEQHPEFFEIILSQIADN